MRVVRTVRCSVFNTPHTYVCRSVKDKKRHVKKHLFPLVLRLLRLARRPEIFTRPCPALSLETSFVPQLPTRTSHAQNQSPSQTLCDVQDPTQPNSDCPPHSTVTATSPAKPADYVPFYPLPLHRIGSTSDDGRATNSSHKWLERTWPPHNQGEIGNQHEPRTSTKNRKRPKANYTGWMTHKQLRRNQCWNSE